ncbi:MAG TPA: hypothetical protein HPQ03_16245, partial [Deltaproteobacteria bacterium]|nr:hypothetical protein [Deltaproteobacteria bacterium]
MAPENTAKEMTLLKEMKQKIEEIDRLASELADIGRGLPVIEKNVQGIQGFTHALRFGISDIA